MSTRKGTVMDEQVKNRIGEILTSYEGRFPDWQSKQIRKRNQDEVKAFCEARIDPILDEACALVKSFGHKPNVKFDADRPGAVFSIGREPKDKWKDLPDPRLIIYKSVGDVAFTVQYEGAYPNNIGGGIKRVLEIGDAFSNNLSEVVVAFIADALGVTDK